MLPKDAIEEFKKLYRKRFGVDLSNEEAARRANNLVNLYRFVYDEALPGPIPVETASHPNQNNEKQT